MSLIHITATKDIRAPGEDSSPIEDSSNIKIDLHLFLLLGTILTCLDPDSQSGSADPFESGSEIFFVRDEFF
jgi:hypothetical protein